MTISRVLGDRLRRLAGSFPVVAVTGPRQSGKTTLVRELFAGKPYLSMEDPDIRMLALDDPRGLLARYPAGAVIDEAQHAPELFSYLQTRVDETSSPGQFVLTGSQNFLLIRGIGQSLAGRSAMAQLPPLMLAELARAKALPDRLDDYLWQGAYPAHYKALPAGEALVRSLPDEWHRSYLMTYLERDVRDIAAVHSLPLFQRFLRLTAARCGQLLNLASLANDCGVALNTVKNWIAILEASYLVFLLRPHHRNFGKRLIKTPKLYFLDTGVAAHLLGIAAPDQLDAHPLRGHLFENMVVAEYWKAAMNAGRTDALYFWRDSTGNEVDLLIEDGRRLIPIEIKSGATLNGDYVRGLNRFAEFAGKDSHNPVLVYGGEGGMNWHGADIMGWKEAGGVYE
ncbi:MAG: ATP-binding protein [Betaproteobacteria bacterium]|nr:ATP-binding protein [Betaproteobacteria bacterium]